MVLDLAIRLEVLEVLEQKVHPEHAPLNLSICSLFSIDDRWLTDLF